MSRSLSFRSVCFSSFASRVALAVAVSSVAVLGGTALAAGNDAGEHQHGRAGHQHGVHDLLRAAEKLPDLTQAQKDQLTKLQESAKSAGPAMHAAHKALADAVAAQVDANKIDRAALAPELKAVDDAATAEQTAHRGALDGLHTLLTPAQRTELADGLEAKISAMEAKHAAKEAQKDASANNAKRGGHEGGPWARELGLSPAQSQQIETTLHANAPATRPAPGAMATQAKQILEDFKGANFRAANVTAPGGGMKPGHIVDFAAAATPVLTDAQRTELGNILRGENP